MIKEKYLDKKQIYLGRIDDNYLKKEGLIKNIDDTNIKNITRYIIGNYFDFSKSNNINVKDSELYKVIIPYDVTQGMLRGEFEFLKDKSGAQLAAIVDSKGKKMVANARLEKVDITIDKDITSKSINDLVMQNMLMDLSRKLDNIDMKLDKILKIQDDEIKSKFTTSINMYNQAMNCSDKNLKNGMIINIITELNSGMDRAYKSAISSIDIISKLPNNNILKNIIMANRFGRYSQENIVKELENLYNKVQLIYIGTSLLSSIYIELNEGDDVIKESTVYMNDLLNYFEVKSIFRFIDDKKTQKTLDASYDFIDSAKQTNKLIENKQDVFIEIRGKDILNIYKECND